MTLPKKSSVAVIGGGISGLAAANRLLDFQTSSHKNLEITLFEADRRLGGTIESVKQDGFVLEKGPDAYIREKPWAAQLAERLGIAQHIIGTKPLNRKSFILRKGRLLPVPEGFYLMAPTQPMSFIQSPLFSIFGKIRILSDYFLPGKAPEGDESLGDFVRRRFGKECLENAAQAMVAGIYTADPDELSLLATMPRFRDLEKKYGSVIRGLIAENRKKKSGAKEASGPRYSLFSSFKGGMQELPDALAQRLSPLQPRLNTKIKQLSFETAIQKWRLVTDRNEVFDFDAVCVTLPANAASKLFKENAPELSAELSKIRFESVATVNMAYRQEQLGRPLPGFGYVSPRSENRAIMACTMVSQKFEHRCPEGFELLRAFVGGAFGRKTYEKDDKELIADAEKDIQDIVGIQGKPYFSLLQRYSGAMVQYGVGHFEWLKKVQGFVDQAPGLYLTGSSYRGVGIPDCIRDAQEQVDKIVQYLERGEGC